MKFDIEGRIKNMRLPDGQTALLYSVFEAVMNGVQAIEERFKDGDPSKNGSIRVEVLIDKNKSVRSIVVKDNGIGLNPSHFDAFNVCDTRQKASIGGRGVGRLIWLKAFHAVSVSSVHETSGGTAGLNFDFRPDLDDSRDNLVSRDADNAEIGTAICLTEPRESETKLSLTLLARNLCHHFFPFFIAGSMPNLDVAVGKRHVDCGQYLSSRMSVEHSETISASEIIDDVTINHVYVDSKIARQLSNSILLTAQGRVVESIEIEKKFALKNLENKSAYACVVGGAFLDEKVDQERTSFKARASDIELIKSIALTAAEKFLADHIGTIRKEQKKLVVNLLEEHPQLAISIENVDEYVVGLSPGMSEEDIGKTLFTLLYRRERKIKDEINKIVRNDDPKAESDQVIAELMRKVSDGAKLRLAEYTVKRHQIIKIARSMLKYADASKGTYELEKTIHDFICPMGKMMRSSNYNDHNLWLIDDLLSYYQFFASDKSLASLSLEGERKEPDLLFFNPIGFRREGTSEPVVIIEFKRPGDERPTSDPIDQVLGYIEKLRDRTVRDAEGEIISDIASSTHFECIILLDLSETAKSRLRRSVAQNPTPDGLGFYGFSPAHNASIRVISYRKLFRDAEIRNQAFFDHLGLLPEEVAKAIRTAMSSGSEASAALPAAV